MWILECLIWLQWINHHMFNLIEYNLMIMCLAWLLIIWSSDLLLQLLCLLTFWLLLRQTLTERRDRQTDSNLSVITVHVEGKRPVCLITHLSVWSPVCLITCLSDRPEDQRVCSHDLQKKEAESYEELLLLGGGEGGVQMVAVVTRMFVKYWIYVCGTMFFFVSFEGKIVLYKVIYMVMFLCCVALYQVILQVLQIQLLKYIATTGTTDAWLSNRYNYKYYCSVALYRTSTACYYYMYFWYYDSWTMNLIIQFYGLWQWVGLLFGLDH